MSEETRSGEDGVFIFDNIKTLDAIFAFLNHDWIRESNGYLWRGQRKESWGLEPTLDRAIPEISGEEYQKATEAVLDRFKLAVRGRSKEPQEKLTIFDWWALGQHHGLLTPLLDWTISPYIAAFFAFSQTEKDDEDKRALLFLHRSEIEKKAREVGDTKVKFINPYYGDNARLINQAGLLSQFSEGIGIEQWVREHFLGSETIVLGKLVMSNDLRVPMLQSLNRMNINYNALFPDIDGAAKHVNMTAQIPKYSPLWGNDE